MIWLFQLHVTIKMKSNHAEIYYNHNNIAIGSHIMIYNCVLKENATNFGSKMEFYKYFYIIK